MQTKHIPERKCIGCNQSKPKNELIRIVKQTGPDGALVFVDKSHKASGRGTYVCKNLDCLNISKKNRRLERKLAQKISDDFYKTLESIINDNEQ